MEYQHTIAKEFRLTGPGLHTGRTVTVTLRPANEDCGIIFRRTDRNNIITQPAIADAVSETSRGTTIGKGRHTIATIEHLMSALHGMGVDNVLVELDGGEIPILDGSARPWLLQLFRVGLRQQQRERQYLTIDEPLHFEVAKTGAAYDAVPCDHFAVHCNIDFPDSVIGKQEAIMDGFDDYSSAIAPCRTFVFLHEIEPLLHLNLIKGGSLDNALVFVNKELSSRQLKRLAKTFNKDVSQFKVHDGVLNTTDPYFPNEPARHKLLDFVGDIRLLGLPVKGQFTITKPGHKSNNLFARYLTDYFNKKEQKNII